MRAVFHAAALAAVATSLAGCSGGTEAVRREWTVMDTTAAVQFRFPAGAADRMEESISAVEGRVKSLFARIERLLNAHDPDSELSRLASLPDGEIMEKCDPSVRACYEAAFAFAEETQGAFNPRWRGPGTMDLGGIAKGYAVDLASDAIASAGLPDGLDVLVDLGGNLKSVRGSWRVGVAGSGETLRLGPGEAVATSAGYFRGAHIKDGRTGKDASAGVYSVSVVSASAMEADALSTILFILGQEEGGRYLAARRPCARAIWLPTVSSGD